MLETGKDCLVCGQRKVLKEFKGVHPVCDLCDNERVSDLVDDQIELRSRKNDWGVAKCECGYYFERLKRNKRGQIVVFEECALCRAKKDYAKSAKEKEYIMPKTKKGYSPREGSATTQKERGTETLSDTTRFISQTERPHTETKTNKKLKNTSENTMQKTKKTNERKSLIAEKQEIRPLDSRPLFDNLREENLTSVQLLKDSTHRLIGYADKLSKPMMDSEQQVVIREQPVENTKEAVKCLEAARNMMKTQLEYMRFGRELAKDLRTNGGE